MTWVYRSRVASSAVATVVVLSQPVAARSRSYGRAAQLLCACGLLALAVSIVSPIDDAFQHDLIRTAVQSLHTIKSATAVSTAFSGMCDLAATPVSAFRVLRLRASALNFPLADVWRQNPRVSAISSHSPPRAFQTTL